MGSDIISVGDRELWPKELWGTRDRAREARLEQATRGARKRETGFTPLPTGTPDASLPGGLYGSEADAERRRRQAANRALEQAGLRPRPW